MTIIIIQILLIAFYFLLGVTVLAQKTLSAVLSQYAQRMNARVVRGVSLVCLLFHAVVILHPWLFLDGLPLSLSYSFSTMMFLAVLIEGGVSMPARVFFPALQAVLLFLSSISVACSVYAEPYALAYEHLAYRELLKAHLLLAIVAASLIIIAFFHALAVVVKEYRLRHLRAMQDDQLPSLLWLESVMFRLFRWSLVCIALLIISGMAVVYTDPAFGLAVNRVKYWLSGLIWLLILSLLWMRHRWGWRGAKIAMSFVVICLLFFAVYIQAVYHLLPVF